MAAGRIGSKMFASIGALFDAAPGISVAAIDIPVGLTDASPRDCDVEAHQVLRPRRSSVIAAPVRPVLGAGSYLEVSDASFRVVGGRDVVAFGSVERR